MPPQRISDTLIWRPVHVQRLGPTTNDNIDLEVQSFPFAHLFRVRPHCNSHGPESVVLDVAKHRLDTFELALHGFVNDIER